MVEQPGDGLAAQVRDQAEDDPLGQRGVVGAHTRLPGAGVCIAYPLP